MGLIINNSPDINYLAVQVDWDISGTNPVINLTNLSQGGGLANMSYAFVALSPLPNTYIHEGEIDTPDVSGIWSTFTLTDNWPKNPFNPTQIVFSGAPYQFYVIAKDSNGNIYQTLPQAASICHPSGNSNKTQSNYGAGNVLVQVMCEQGRVFFQDVTAASYQGITGTPVSSIINVRYPMDDTGVAPTNFTGADFVTALVPITFSGPGYQFLYRSRWNYDVGNDTTITIQYLQNRDFSVLCNIDLSVLTCEFEKLAQSFADGSCSNQQEAQNKMNLINPKMFLVMMGIAQPLSIGNKSVYELIDQIKEIGGFDCDCCTVASGIIPQTSSVIDGYLFGINPVCGDITGTVTTVGNNITFNLQDKSYTFTICNDSPPTTTAFSVVRSVDGCTVNYCLSVDGNQLAEDILNNIKNSAELVNLFNSIVNAGSGAFSLIVDGKCVFASAASYDYAFDLGNIPYNTTFAILTGFNINGIVVPLNFSFNLTNVPALQAYLNGLGFGTFAAVGGSPDDVVITSTGNPTNINALYYQVGITSYSAAMTKTPNGFVALSANQVVQNIINYLCGINDADIVTSAAYTICYLDPVTGQSKTVVVNSGTELTTLFTTLLAAGCNTLTYINSLPQLNCAGVSSLFPSNPTPLQLSDVVYGKKSGICAQITVQELILQGLTLGADNAAIQNAVCNLVTNCGAGLPCAPYTVFQVTTSPYSTSCPDVNGMTYNFVGANLYITQVGFVNTPSTSQFVTVEYKLHSDPGYTLASASSQVNINGAIVVPVVISLVAGDMYDIRISNNCQSPPDYFVQTITVPGVDDTWIISYTNDISSVKIELYIGNNNSTPTTLLYSGLYFTDPLTGSDPINLPAVNARVLMIISSLNPMVTADCNSVLGSISGGGTVAQWSGVNGAIVIDFTTS